MALADQTLVELLKGILEVGNVAVKIPEASNVIDDPIRYLSETLDKSIKLGIELIESTQDEKERAKLAYDFSSGLIATGGFF